MNELETLKLKKKNNDALLLAIGNGELNRINKRILTLERELQIATNSNAKAPRGHHTEIERLTTRKRELEKALTGRELTVLVDKIYQLEVANK